MAILSSSGVSAVSIDSTQGISATLSTNSDKIPLNKMQPWVLELKTQNSPPVPDNLVVEGGMEAHGHALPTSPVIEKSGDSGAYQIRGLKFQMPGQWFVEIKELEQSEAIIRFDFEVSP